LNTSLFSFFVLRPRMQGASHGSSAVGGCRHCAHRVALLMRSGGQRDPLPFQLWLSHLLWLEEVVHMLECRPAVCRGRWTASGGAGAGALSAPASPLSELRCGEPAPAAGKRRRRCHEELYGGRARQLRAVEADRGRREADRAGWGELEQLGEASARSVNGTDAALEATLDHCSIAPTGASTTNDFCRAIANCSLLSSPCSWILSADPGGAQFRDAFKRLLADLLHISAGAGAMAAGGFRRLGAAGAPHTGGASTGSFSARRPIGQTGGGNATNIGLFEQLGIDLRPGPISGGVLARRLLAALLGISAARRSSAPGAARRASLSADPSGR
jgi:hypothetical protein